VSEGKRVGLWLVDSVAAIADNFAMKIRLVTFSLAVLSVAFAAPCLGQWYLGGEVGYTRHTFGASYTFAVGEPDTYVNTAQGVEGGVIGGYTFAGQGQVSLSIQGRVAGNTARWKLDVVDEYSGTPQGGPASLAYDMPWGYSLSLVPGVRVGPSSRLVAEFGIGQSLVREVKTSAQSTRYDYSDWAFSYAFGAGVHHRLGERWELRGTYRYIRCASFSYSGAFPDGTVWEHVTDTPHTHQVCFGLVYRWE